MRPFGWKPIKENEWNDKMSRIMTRLYYGHTTNIIMNTIAYANMLEHRL